MFIRRNVIVSLCMLGSPALAQESTGNPFLDSTRESPRYAIAPVPMLDFEGCEARSINESGNVAGTCLNGGNLIPIVWDGLNLIELLGAGGTSTPGDLGTADAIANNDHAYGFAHRPSGQEVLVDWPATLAPTVLANPAPANFIVADVSNQGVLVGAELLAGSATKAKWWHNGALHSFPNIPGSTVTATLAYAVDASGQVVGEAVDTVGDTVAVLWAPTGNTYTSQPQILDRTGLGSVVRAHGISTDGALVAGSATNGGSCSIFGFAFPNNIALGWSTSGGSVANLGWSTTPSQSSQAVDVNIHGLFGGNRRPTASCDGQQAYVQDPMFGHYVLFDALAPGHPWQSLATVVEVTNSNLLLGLAIWDGDSDAPEGSPLGDTIVRNFVAKLITEPVALNGAFPGYAGTTNTITASDVTPGETVRFVEGTPNGTTPVPSCSGTSFDLGAATLIGTAVADSNGHAVLTMAIPASYRGTVSAVQAVTQTSCEVSNTHLLPWE